MNISWHEHMNRALYSLVAFKCFNVLQASQQKHSHVHAPKNK